MFPMMVRDFDVTVVAGERGLRWFERCTAGGILRPSRTRRSWRRSTIDSVRAMCVPTPESHIDTPNLPKF